MDSTHDIRDHQQSFGLEQIILHDPASTKNFKFNIKWNEATWGKKKKIFERAGVYYHEKENTLNLIKVIYSVFWQL